MAATSTRNAPATGSKKPAIGAAGSSSATGLTPIWIRLPRLSEEGTAVDGIDPEETAPSFAEAEIEPPPRPAPAKASAPKAPAERPKSSRQPVPPAPPVAEADPALADGMPDYLRRLADRAEAEDDEAEAPVARKKSRGEKRAQGSVQAESGGFLSHLLKAPYNVLAGIALVALFVCLYAYFRPPAAETTLPELEAGPSLSLDLGQPSADPSEIAGAVEAVDPGTLYPEMPSMGDGGFQPATPAHVQPANGVASANYGTDAASEFAPATQGPVAGTPAMTASSSMKVTAAGYVDPALSGLPLDSYPETDPANYRYSADATIEIPSPDDRTAAGDVPRAASLGDSLEQTPVQGPGPTY